MEKQYKTITNSGNYNFGDNHILTFIKNNTNFLLDNCNITCGNDCVIQCGTNCNITCGNNCIIRTGYNSLITCGDNCIINNEFDCTIICGINCKIRICKNCLIKAGENSSLSGNNITKQISKDENFIWWFIDRNNENWSINNTFEDEKWKENNPEKFKEFYPFVHNELDSSTLF